jgi:hypothetical protein
MNKLTITGTLVYAFAVGVCLMDIFVWRPAF